MSQASSDSVDSESSCKADDLLSGYELLNEIGKGGMSTVYLARAKITGRELAIKILNPELAGSQTYLRRFANEARALCSLEHENIVKVYTFGLSKSSQACILMEYLPGRSLRQLLQEKKQLGFAEFCQIFQQVLEALSYAHEKQIIHRDLKPDNIMIVDGAEPIVKLLDFGIAKVLNTEANEQKLTTGLLGTPLYMSPEQCAGESPDLRCDVYALACIMYEAICGEPPFMADTAILTMYKRMTRTMPTKAKLLKYKDYGHNLLDLIMRALERDPDKRPDSALAFKSEFLQAIQSEERKNAPVAFSAFKQLATLVSLAAILVFSFVVFKVIYQQHKDAVSKEQKSLSHQKNRVVINPELNSVVSKADKLVDRGQTDMAIKMYKTAMKKAESLSEPSERRRALEQAHSGLAALYANKGEVEPALEEYRAAISAYDEVQDPVIPRRMSRVRDYVYCLERFKRRKEAIKYTKENLEKCESYLKGEGNERVADQYFILAGLLDKDGLESKAIEQLRHALKHYDNSPKKRCTEGAVDSTFLFVRLMENAGKNEEACKELNKTYALLGFYKEERARSSYTFAKRLIDRKRQLAMAESALNLATKYTAADVPNLRIRRDLEFETKKLRDALVIWKSQSNNS